jgi:hypothetical protein
VLWAASVALLAFTTGGCSRHDAAPAVAGAPALDVSAPSASTAAVPAPGLGPEPSPVLIPEDADDDAARRITEQNLESELDRLEREIQAE